MIDLGYLTCNTITAEELDLTIGESNDYERIGDTGGYNVCIFRGEDR